jgi:hypothetical protein
MDGTVLRQDIAFWARSGRKIRRSAWGLAGRDDPLRDQVKEAIAIAVVLELELVAIAVEGLDDERLLLARQFANVGVFPVAGVARVAEGLKGEIGILEQKFALLIAVADVEGHVSGARRGRVLGAYCSDGREQRSRGERAESDFHVDPPLRDLSLKRLKIDKRLRIAGAGFAPLGSAAIAI